MDTGPVHVMRMKAAQHACGSCPDSPQAETLALLGGLQEAEMNAQALRLVWATGDLTYHQMMVQLHASALQQELALMPAEEVCPDPMMI